MFKMQGKLLFLLKFLFLVSVAMLGWLLVAPGYLRILGQESAAILNALGYTVLSTGVTQLQIVFQLDTTHNVSFAAISSTLNLVVFVALVVATPGTPWRRRLASLVLGTLLLHLAHVGYLLGVFTVNYTYEPTSAVSRAFASITDMLHLLLPFLLWAVMEAPRLFRKRPTAPPAFDGVG